MRLMRIAATVLGGALLGPVSLHADSDWVQASDAHTAVVLEEQSRFNPEVFTAFGVTIADDQILDLKSRSYERQLKSNRELLEDLRQRQQDETDNRVAQDLDILVKAIEDQITSAELNRKYMLPYYNLSQAIYLGFNSLLDPRNDPERYPAALKRLKKYNGKSRGYEPITDLAIERTWERFDVPGLLGPYRRELERDLANVPRFKAGMQQLFAQSGLEGYEKDLELLNTQLDEYAEWLRKELLPRTREDFRLPEELYADNLKSFGVDADPRELIRQAQLGFTQIKLQMQAIARQVAELRGLPDPDYRAVIRELQKEQVSKEDLMPLYESRLAAIEAMIREHDIVTLPDRPAVIRHATEAEAAAVPAPFMNPPQLIGNTGQSGEFVLVSGNPSDTSGEGMNDFGSVASTWALTTHEARPGHEMQFAAMVEGGVSNARVIYALNSANVEGWGLYAEAIMIEYFDLEAQLLGLRSLLLRAARAFLDPMLNLGLITPEQAHDFLVKEGPVSSPMATQEVDRYTFLLPGQATSYYYGFMNLMAMRAEVEVLLRERFKQREFHDFLLAQGVLPPNILRQAVLDGYVKNRAETAESDEDE